ncbi:MAG: nuclear transport factor 2 family protein [Marinicaulis sp.]|nr:nuclear transport factor 2 family protein [Marinicaulis sp.]NNE39437.1 nuclear transport factor 2 family protein [Marinicaulis sp.]
MNRFIAILICVFVLATEASVPAYAGDRNADIAELTEKKVKVWRRLYAERDADGLDEFLADGFKILEPNGNVRLRADEIEWLRNAPRDERPNNFIFTITDIIFSDDDVAIVFGHGDSTRENDAGEPCHHKYWSSNTFIQQDGEWKPIFSHVSGAACKMIE